MSLWAMEVIEKAASHIRKSLRFAAVFLLDKLTIESAPWQVVCERFAELLTDVQVFGK